MIRRIFLSEESKETGELGWKDTRIKNNSVYLPNADKLSVAHDAMEHFNFRDIGDEIEAHAAMYYIRYLGGYNNEYGRNINLQMFGHEFLNLGIGIQSNSTTDFLDMQKRASCKLDGSVEEDLEQIIQHGRETLNNEGYAGYEGACILENYAEYFRRGFRKTIKLYSKVESWHLAYMFQKLEYALKKIGRPEYGQRLTIKLNPKTEEVKVNLDYAEDY